jgi:hypothetical protein
MTLHEVLTDDTIDMVTMDVPFLIRILEWAREDAKTDIEIHNAVEKMIAQKSNISMGDYAKIVDAAV